MPCSTTSAFAPGRPAADKKVFAAHGTLPAGSCGLAPAVVYDQEVAGKVGTAAIHEHLEEMDPRMTPDELDQIAETERAAARSHITQRVNVCRSRPDVFRCQSQSVKRRARPGSRRAAAPKATAR